MASVIDRRIECVAGVRSGKPCIAGTRITVSDVAIWHEQLGLSAADIVERYPHLSAADVAAALSYLAEHRDEIDREIAAGDAFVAELQSKTPSKLTHRP